MPKTPTRLSTVEAFKRGARPEEPVELHNIVAHTEEPGYGVASQIRPSLEAVRAKEVRHGESLTVTVEELGTSTATNGERSYRVLVGDLLELPTAKAALVTSEGGKVAFRLTLSRGLITTPSVTLGRALYDTVRAAIWWLYVDAENEVREARERMLERVSSSFTGTATTARGEHGC